MTRKEKLSLMKELYEAGEEKEVIAQKTGYSINSIGALLTAVGIKRRKFANDYKTEIIRLYKEGKTAKEIGDVLGFTQDTVRILLNEHGYKGKEYAQAAEPIDEENLKMAERVIVPEKVVVHGKTYIDTKFEMIYG